MGNETVRRPPTAMVSVNASLRLTTTGWMPVRPIVNCGSNGEKTPPINKSAEPNEEPIRTWTVAIDKSPLVLAVVLVKALFND